MKSCVGCKHLGHSLTCLYEVGNQYYEYWTDPYTETKMVTYLRRPKLKEQRSTEGLCGPEAKLYSPTLMRRFKNALFGAR